MKFSELSLGQQFEWQGQSYSKISSLMAQQLGSGEQKFIARAARVRLLEAGRITPQVSDEKFGAVDVAKMRLAARAYHTQAGRILEDLTDHLPPEVLERAKRALAQGWERLLAEIEKPDSSKSEPTP